MRAVPAALRSEWIKLASLRANKVVLALTPVIGGLIAWALASSTTDTRLTASELFIFPLPLRPSPPGLHGRSCTSHWPR